MSHILRDIFTNDELKSEIKIRFKNEETDDKFKEAMNRVYESGESTQISGPASVMTKIYNGTFEYFTEKADENISFIIEPKMREASFNVVTEYGVKSLLLNYCFVKGGIILKNSDDDIVYLKLFIEAETTRLNLELKMQPEKAKNVSDIIEQYLIIESFLNEITVDGDSEDENIFLSQMRNNFNTSISFYKRVLSIEDLLDIRFKPEKMEREWDDLLDFYELYYILVENKAVRLKGKVTVGDENIKVDEDVEAEIGQTLEISFVHENKISLWGVEIEIHTVNYLGNAVIKDVRKTSDCQMNIIYGDNDCRPLYISYKGYKTAKEAETEQSQIIENRENYINAKTVEEYLQDDHLLM